MFFRVQVVHDGTVSREEFEQHGGLHENLGDARVKLRHLRRAILESTGGRAAGVARGATGIVRSCERSSTRGRFEPARGTSEGDLHSAS